MIRYRIRVTGRVQGVFYRASTQRKAEELGLSGWVKNEVDGSVLMEVEGLRPQVNAMMEWCKKGPDHARVETLDFSEMGALGIKGFSIKR